MRYDTFKNLKMNKQGIRPCVIIQTGEEGNIVKVDKYHDRLLVVPMRHGYINIQEQWFNYTEIAIW
jgi:hypothetical protein